MKAAFGAPLCILLLPGKWRYLLTGALTALLLYAVCRLISSLTAPFGKWRRFRGICTEADGGFVRVTFQDARHMTHIAALRLPEAVRVLPGESVRFAVSAECLQAGTVPQHPSDISETCPAVRHIAAYRRLMLHMLLKRGIAGLILCGISLSAWLIAVKLCFPGDG